MTKQEILKKHLGTGRIIQLGWFLPSIYAAMDEWHKECLPTEDEEEDVLLNTIKVEYLPIMNINAIFLLGVSACKNFVREENKVELKEIKGNFE